MLKKALKKIREIKKGPAAPEREHSQRLLTAEGWKRLQKHQKK